MAGAAAATLGCEVTSENAGHVWRSSKTGVRVTLTVKHSITSGLSMVCELRTKIKHVKAHLFLVTTLRLPCYCLITQSNVHLRALCICCSLARDKFPLDICRASSLPSFRFLLKWHLIREVP